MSEWVDAIQSAIWAATAVAFVYLIWREWN